MEQAPVHRPPRRSPQQHRGARQNNCEEDCEGPLEHGATEDDFVGVQREITGRVIQYLPSARGTTHDRRENRDGVVVRSHPAQEIQHRGDGRTDQGRPLHDSQRAGGHAVAVLLRNGHGDRPDDDADGCDVHPTRAANRGCGLVIGAGLDG